MSFDLLVFDPDVAPTERRAFLDWYRAQASQLTGNADPASGIMAERLSSWLAEMRRDFPSEHNPALNGSAKGNGHWHLIDYAIGPCAIHATFHWPEAEGAYTAARALAVKHGVGLYFPKGGDGQIWFPGGGADGKEIADLALTLEGQHAFNAPSAALIEAAVDWLDPVRGPGFLILERINGHYVRVGGGGDSCTAEWGAYSGSGFRNWVAGLAGGETGKVISIDGHDATFTVRANERLTNALAKAILVAFATGQPRPSQFLWRETTADYETGKPAAPPAATAATSKSGAAGKPWWQFW